MTQTTQPQEAKTKHHYIIKVSSACMPVRCWGDYVRIGLLEVEPGVTEVSMISERARGVVRVVATWEKLNRGATNRCASARAYAEAERLKAKLECL